MLHDTVPIDSHSLSDMTVLVVDDEPDAREIVAHIFKARGARVHEADGPRSALAFLTLHTPTIIISDIAMPEEDGYSLMKRIRSLANEEKRRIPAIALTAFARDVDRHRALRSGFDVHLPKPLQLSMLVDSVMQLTSTQSLNEIRVVEEVCEVPTVNGAIELALLSGKEYTAVGRVTADTMEALRNGLGMSAAGVRALLKDALLNHRTGDACCVAPTRLRPVNEARTRFASAFVQRKIWVVSIGLVWHDVETNTTGPLGLEAAVRTQMRVLVHQLLVGPRPNQPLVDALLEWDAAAALVVEREQRSR